MTATGDGVEGLTKKEKGLMDMDNSVQCGGCGGRGCKETEWKWEKKPFRNQQKRSRGLSNYPIVTAVSVSIYKYLWSQ